MNLEAELTPLTTPITQAFAQAAGMWIGCDWPTRFGVRSFNLENLSSTQAVLMARATAGKEADAWWEASRWLTRVEQDALSAEREAQVALQAGLADLWVAALAHARNACDIEARYHRQLIWQPLRDAIESALRASPPR